MYRKPESTTEVDYTGARSPMSSYIEAKYNELKGLLSIPASAYRPLQTVTIIDEYENVSRQSTVVSIMTRDDLRRSFQDHFDKITKVHDTRPRNQCHRSTACFWRQFPARVS